MGIILGCNAGIFSDVVSVVPRHTGCRSYRDATDDIPKSWPGAAGATATLVSLRPRPDNLLSGALDDKILALLAVASPGAALTVWHEAGNLYQDFDFITPSSVRQMHVKMRNLCQQAGTGVGYGVCIYGTIAEMDKWIPHAPHAMDWYGIDVYDNMNSNNGGTFRNASDAVDDSKINAYMDEFRDLARDRTGLTSPSINIPECNSPILAHRPRFFRSLAEWLFDNGGRGMYTFFKDGGPSGGPWVPDDTATIDALNHIANHP